MTDPAIRPENHHTNPRTVAFPGESVSITAESDALVATTTANWLDVSGWRTALGADQRYWQGLGVQQRFEGFQHFELDIEGDAAETITAAELYAVRLAPVTIDDDTFTSSGTDAVNTAVAHGMLTGDGPFQLTTTDTLPAGLSLLTDYWVEKTAADTFELYTSRALAIASGGGVATTDTGTGTHTIADVQGSANADDDTRRCRLALVGRLNSGAATIGTITVGAQTSYVERIEHSPLDLYYVVVATVGAVETLTIRATPIMTVDEN